MKLRSATCRTEEGIENTEGRKIPRGPEAGTGGNEAWPEAAEAGGGPALPVILAATDGSEASLAAGEHAVRLAGELGARLIVLYVVDEDAAFHAGIHYGDAVAELVRVGREATARVASLAAERGVECREAVVSGKPYRTIVSVADKLAARYIVLGSHGGYAFERAVLGSVSAKVLHLAEHPVLVVGGRVPSGAPATSGSGSVGGPTQILRRRSGRPFGGS